MSEIHIVPAQPQDFEVIWPFFHQIVQACDTYAIDPNINRKDAEAYWMGNGMTTFVAQADNHIVGSFYIRPNQTGPGNHVANAGFMVNPHYSGKGVGRFMGEFALAEAKQVGYLAMQFNFVVSTNQVAVRLWQSLGFQIVGIIPKAYRHATLGLVDALIMHRFL